MIRIFKPLSIAFVSNENKKKNKQFQAQILLLIPLLIPLGWCEPLKGKQPLVYPNWPPTKSKLPMRTLMLQIRSGSRLPASYLMKGYPQSQRFHRPLKMSIPNFNYLKSPMFKRPLTFAPQQNKHKFVKFHGSPPGPNTGEYIYETPILAHGTPQVYIKFFCNLH